jgi:(p)ppGpp synthase/HD superfamily hydrolase
MSLIVERAFELALVLHQSQSRKASIVPNAAYLGHLTEVAGMAWGCFANDDPALGTTVAAALLHDAIEDQPQKSPRELIVAHCGRDVLELILELTEQGVEGIEKAPWHDRKVAYLSHIQELSVHALLISVCDKLQSARELKRQVRLKGLDAYTKLGMGDDPRDRRESVLWFHNNLVLSCLARLTVIGREFAGPLIVAINVLLDELAEVVLWLEEN